MELLAYNIKNLNDAIEKRANGELAKYNITLSQARIICLLDKSPVLVSMKDLEHCFALSQATVQGTVARMEKKGYLDTTYMPGDRRTKYVKLTDCGKKLAGDILTTVFDINNWVGQNLTENEKLEFAQLLCKVQQSIG